MNIETIKFLKAITDAFGQDDAVQFEQATWEKIHAGIKEAIAELESQEPVAMYREKCADGKRCLHGCHTNEPCYTHPPQEQQSCDKRTWVGLTDEEAEDIVESCDGVGWDVAQVIRKKLKEKNT